MSLRTMRGQVTAGTATRHPGLLISGTEVVFRDGGLLTAGLEANWKELDRTTAVVSLAGELDLAGVGELEPPINERLRRSSLIVDLSDLEFIDSAGLGVLYSAHRSAQASKRGFAVVHGSARAVTALLELTRASSQIPLFSSIAAAKASL